MSGAIEIFGVTWATITIGINSRSTIATRVNSTAKITPRAAPSGTPRTIAASVRPMCSLSTPREPRSQPRSTTAPGHGST